MNPLSRCAILLVSENTRNNRVLPSQVMDILDRMSGTVSPAFFLQNIWLVMLTTQVPRAYCLTYLSRRLPRLDSNEGMHS